MIFTVFCCTFLPQRLTYHLSHSTCLLNNSSLQKIDSSSHPKHVFFHKGSRALTKTGLFSNALPQNSFPHKPCLLSKTLPKNESHMILHKACLFNNSSLQTILSSSHPKHVSLHAFFHKESHILSPNPCPFSMALPHKIQFTYLPTQTMPSFKGSSTNNSHILPHKPCLVSKTLPQKIHTSSHPTHVCFACLLSMKQGQHI